MFNNVKDSALLAKEILRVVNAKVWSDVKYAVKGIKYINY
jgi:hypothetical protein